jgi:pimeloyl-ACP methyl ester carboxylesterase
MTITGHINRLRQHVTERQPGNVMLVGSSMGALVGLRYAHRFGGVERLLLLAPALFYKPPVTGADMERWQTEGTIAVPHYAFRREVPLRYHYHVDGMQYRRPVPPPAPMTIIHGRHDQVIPLTWSQQYTADFRHSVRLLEVDDDHRLSGQLDVIWQQVESMLA